ncbi:MAG: hypothetical protein P4M07_25330 [Xanthobacteraceae bacterium]|nr:hypothetical protein [Xanthobacteraceae bacterium]
MFRPTSARTVCAAALLPIQWMSHAPWSRKRVRGRAVSCGTTNRTAFAVLAFLLATGGAIERVAAGGTYSNLGPWSTERTQNPPGDFGADVVPRADACGSGNCPDRHSRSLRSIRHAHQR